MDAIGAEPELVEITDERDPRAEAALRLFSRAFSPSDRQPLDELRSEIEEKRLGLLTIAEYHLLVAVTTGNEVAAAVSGIYLAGINAGFVYYLVVDPAYRGETIARQLRSALVERFHADARQAGHAQPASVLGEVRRSNPWLRGLVRRRGAIVFDFEYYHPGMELDADEPYVLYRQPLGDARTYLPAAEVARILYQIYRRAYRVRYPLRRDTFRAMIENVRRRGEIGPHPDFEISTE